VKPIRGTCTHISHIFIEQSLPLILRPIGIRTPTQPLPQYNFSTMTKYCSLLEVIGRGGGRGRGVLKMMNFSQNFLSTPSIQYPL